jgi:hypothetical protein
MKVYVGDKHPHEAQNPKTYNIQDVVKWTKLLITILKKIWLNLY